MSISSGDLRRPSGDPKVGVVAGGAKCLLALLGTTRAPVLGSRLV